MADSSVFTTDLGAVTAYADAKAHGYTGTREEFATLLANAGNNLAEANAAKAAAQTSATQAGQSATAAAASAKAAASAVGAAFYGVDFSGSTSAGTRTGAAGEVLIVNAKIAGSNVNDAGCTPVVRVTYSIIPMFETGDTQTATAGGVGSNR